MSANLYHLIWNDNNNNKNNNNNILFHTYIHTLTVAILFNKKQIWAWKM